MQVIQHQELASSQASITFSSIPQTYTDLYLVVSAKLNFAATTASLGVFFNTAAGDTSYRYLRGTGSSVNSASDSARQDFYIGEAAANSSTASTFSSFAVYIPNFTSSNQKSMSSEGVHENNATTAYQFVSAGLCTKTAAITSLTVRGFEGTSGNLVQYSSATLYGITKGSDGIVTVS
jgi:hypothetical protein